MKFTRVNLSLANKVHDSVLVDGSIEYEFQKRTVQVDKEEILAYLRVDAYVNGEWDLNLSKSYEPGEDLNDKNAAWLKLINM